MVICPGLRKVIFDTSHIKGRCLATVMAFLVALVGISLIVFRMIYLEDPVYGGDEFSYWINAKLINLEKGLHPQGSHIGAVTNWSYLFFLNICQSISFTIVSVQFANLILLLISAWLAWIISKGILPSYQALIPAAFIFISGVSVFSVAAMPEAFLMFLFLVQTAVVVRLWVPGYTLVAAILGILSGLMVLTKPHGVALTAGGILAIISYSAFSRKKKDFCYLVLRDVFFWLLSSYLTVSIIRSVFEAQIILSPVGFAGPLYGGIASRAISETKILELFLNGLWFLSAHLAVVFSLFSPAFFQNYFCLTQIRRSGSLESKHALLSFWTFWILLMLLGLVSAFSVVVGEHNPFEANRLHIRYWSCLTPVLLIVSLSALNMKLDSVSLYSPRREAILHSAWFLLCASALVFVFCPNMRLFPWDGVEVFGLYQPRPDDWNHDAMIPFSRWIVTGLFIVAFLSFLLDKIRAGAYLLMVIGIITIGNLRTTEWQSIHMREVEPLVKEAKEIGGELKDSGPGVVITDVPWGVFSHVRFHLPALTSEVVQPSDRKLTEKDISKGVKWIVAKSSDDLTEIRTANLSRKLSKLSLYRVNSEQ